VIRADADPGTGSAAPAVPRTRLRPAHALALFLVTSAVFVAPALVIGASMGAVENVLLYPPYAETAPTAPEVGIGLQGDQAVQLGLPAEFYGSLRSGELQLWEPDIAGGSPMFTGVYNRVLSPLNWPFLVLPAPLATTASVWLSVFIAQVGTYALARRLHIGVGGAMVAGVVYGFCGPLMSAVLRYHEMFLLPAWLFAIHGTVTDGTRRWGYAALTGALTALVWVSGFPAAGVMATYTAGAFTLYLLVSRAADLASWAARGRFVVGTGAVVAAAVAAGLAVAAIQLLPTLEFLDTTLARTRRYEGGHLLSAALAGMISGRFFGAEQDGDWWFPELVNVIESSSTLGMVALAVLATVLVGVRSRADRAAERPLVAFVLPLALALVIADYHGGRVLSAFLQLPLLDESLFTRSRFIAFLMLALCVGYGVDRLLARHPGGARPAALLRVELAIGALLVLNGLRRGFGAALSHNAELALAKDLIVPVLSLLVATAAAIALRRRAKAAAVVLALAAAVELQWGAFGLTPFSEVAEFYPDHPAIDVVENSIGEGDQHRFMDRRNLVLYGGAAPYLGLRDALANWPAFGPYQQIIELSDPQVAASSEGKAVFEPTFSDELDLGAPALDAAAVGWYLAPLAEPPVQIGGRQRLLDDFAGGGRPGRTDADTERVRAVEIAPLRRQQDCASGFVDLRIGEHRSRRPVRDVATPDVAGVTTPGAFTFPLPDVTIPAGSEVSVTTTSCAVDLDDAVVTAMTASPDTDVVLESVTGWQAYRRPDALPRLDLAERAVTVTDAAERLQRLDERVDHGQILLSGPGPVGPFGPGAATFLQDGNDRVAVEVRSEGPGLLVLRDVAAPGWQATVNGRPTEILRADHAFRAVAVPDGSSTVVFRYFPDALRLGITTAILGVLALLAMLGVQLSRRRNRRSRIRA